MKILEAQSISKAFAGVQALKDVSFDLLQREVHALIGENGAGKSTLIKVMTGAVQADSGTLVVGGQPVLRNDPAIARSLGIAAIYQQPSLFPHLTVSENIALALETGSSWRRVNWKERDRRAKELLGRIGASIDPARVVSTLSMPEQQLVEIAKAIGAEATILIMDEPTSSLTDREVENLFTVIDLLRGHEVGIIYISHRLEEIVSIADRITVLRDGETIATRQRNEVGSAQLISMIAGRELATVFPKRDVPIGDTALELRNVGNRARGLHDISISVRSGEILGVAGLVGAGRTELAETIFGLTPADVGDVLLRGTRVRISSPLEAVRCGIGYVPEDRRQHGVILNMPITVNTSLARLKSVARSGLIDAIEERQLAERYVRQLSVKTPSVYSELQELSGGNQQKIALARWLAIEPSVLILDEPTQGVDIGSKAEIHRFMVELAERGVAIIMISSELSEILGMSDRIVVMHGGTVAGVLSKQEASQEKILSFAIAKHTSPSGRGGREAAGEGLKVSPNPATLAQPSPRGRGLAVAIAITALAAVLAIAAPGYFAYENLSDMFLANIPVLVVALGMTLVILTGQIDISVGSVFAICSVAAGVLAKSGLPLPAAALAACIVGGGLGSLNGALVAYAGIPSIVVTLASMVALRDALRWQTQGAWIQDMPRNFQWLGFSQGAYPAAAFLSVALLIVLFAWGLRNLAAGRAIYATGSNSEGARLAAIDISLTRFSVFVIAGALTGFAAVLNAVRFNQIPSNTGLGLEMKVIAAVIVGGAAITGGVGTIAGTVLGVVLLGAIGPALTFLAVSAYWEKAIQGGIILTALIIDAARARE